MGSARTDIANKHITRTIIVRGNEVICDAIKSDNLTIERRTHTRELEISQTPTAVGSCAQQFERTRAKIFAKEMLREHEVGGEIRRIHRPFTKDHVAAIRA